MNHGGHCKNKGQKVGAIIMDLYKAFDTLNPKLLFKKLQAYGFDKKSLSFIESYFTNRKKRTKIGDVALVNIRESLQGYHKT